MASLQRSRFCRPTIAPRSEGGVPPSYQRFIATTGHAATLWPFGSVAGAYLSLGAFSPGPGGLLQFLVRPFRTCCRHYPAGASCDVSQCFAFGAAFPCDREGRPPEFVTHEACTTFDTYGPHDCYTVFLRDHPGTSHGRFPRSCAPWLHGSGSFHVGTLTHWV